MAQYLLLCGRAGNTVVAHQLWQEARNMGIAHFPVVTGSMLSVLVMHGADGETLELLKGIPPASLNSYMVTSALTAFSHSGNVDAAHALLEQVEMHGSQTPIQSYTALVDGYARRGDFASALAIIDRAKCQRVGEDDVMWVTVLGPCRRFKNLPVAQTAFAAIQRLGSLNTVHWHMSSCLTSTMPVVVLWLRSLCNKRDSGRVSGKSGVQSR